MATSTSKPPAQRTQAPATQPLLQANLSFTKSTKGAHRYDAPQNEADRLGGPLNIYFRKESFKGDPPQNITITVTPMA